MFSKIAITAIFSALISCDAAVIRKRTLPTDMALQDTSSGLCLSNYAADDQLYSGPNDVPNVFSLTSDGISLFDVLTDTTVGKFCVGSEGGGTANQFQCSGDADSVSGGGQEFSYEPISDYLTYNNDATFFACGDATTGVNYFARGDDMGCFDNIVRTIGGDTTNEGSCQTVNLMFVNPSQCGSLSSSPKFAA